MTDVARAAGFSQTTVSLILARKTDARFTGETRARVLEAARTLGYNGAGRRAGRPPEGRGVAAHGRLPDAAGIRSQTGKVVLAIGLEIVSGRFPAGDLLPRDAVLMARFGVSRTVLREALRVLSGKRLLFSKAGTGTLVLGRCDWNLFDPDILAWHARAGVSASLITAVEEIRWALEPEAAALAAARRRDEDLSVLYALVERMAVPGLVAGDFVEADYAFHVAVASASGNPFLASISSLIRLALITALTKSWPGDEEGGTVRSATDHRAIVDAIAAGDAARARETMRVVVAEGMRRQAEGESRSADPVR